jgi:hypothetical protein
MLPILNVSCQTSEKANDKFKHLVSDNKFSYNMDLSCIQPVRFLLTTQIKYCLKEVLNLF